MRLALGSDHIGFVYKEKIKLFLQEKGSSILDLGCFSEERTDYPSYAALVAQAICEGDCSHGILFCGTGVGMSLAANQFKGVRAVVCSEPYTAKLSKEHNNTNVLALGSRVIGFEMAKMIILAWLDASFEGGRHQERITILESMRGRQ